MTSAETAFSRTAAVQGALAERNLPALFITNLVNVGWLTGFTGSNGFALITASDAVFATDSRYTEQAAAQCAGFRIEKLASSAPEEITALLGQLGVPSIGFEADHISVRLYDTYREKLPAGVSLVPTSGIVDSLRMIKDSDEISRIQAAVDVADRTWDHIVPFLKPGAVERDIMLEMEWFIRRTCGGEVAFDIIVASGPRSALPHGKAADRVFQAGDLVTLDFGAKLNGYNSDITRTVVLGEPTAEQRKVYGVVRDTLYRSIDGIRPGRSGRDIHLEAVEMIGSAGYGDYFGHGLGHGLGRTVHDHIAFSIRSETTIREQMVVTVEPGIYVPGWGGVRIEHDVVVGPDGARLLDQSTTDLLAL